MNLQEFGAGKKTNTINDSSHTFSRIGKRRRVEPIVKTDLEVTTNRVVKMYRISSTRPENLAKDAVERRHDPSTESSESGTSKVNFGETNDQKKDLQVAQISKSSKVDFRQRRKAKTDRPSSLLFGNKTSKKQLVRSEANLAPAERKSRVPQKDADVEGDFKPNPDRLVSGSTDEDKRWNLFKLGEKLAGNSTYQSHLGFSGLDVLKSESRSSSMEKREFPVIENDSRIMHVTKANEIEAENSSKSNDHAIYGGEISMNGRYLRSGTNRRSSRSPKEVIHGYHLYDGDVKERTLNEDQSLVSLVPKFAHSQSTEQSNTDQCQKKVIHHSDKSKIELSREQCQYGNLEEHFQRNNQPRNQKSIIEVEPRKCVVCERQFSRKDHLVRHMRLHTGIRPHECKACEKAFSRKDHLANHVKSHSRKRK